MTDPMNPFHHASQNSESDQQLQKDVNNQANPELYPIKPPFPINIYNLISGRYSGKTSVYQLELRIDIDGTRHCNLVSGDFYIVRGRVKSYFASFKSAPVRAIWSPSHVIIEGTLSSTKPTEYDHFKISVVRTGHLFPPAPATITFYNAAGVTAGTYSCKFESHYFHTLNLEEDFEEGCTLFDSYDTNLMAHAGEARTLDVITAYKEAGIEMLGTRASNSVLTNEAGTDSVWTNAELEAAMHHNFSLISDSPKWQTYLLACKSRHEETSGDNVLFGIMFDYEGTSQRQGCAVFQSQVDSFYGGAGSNDAVRHTLYCYVHELGHSFNLLHSWDKSRPDSLSWMNYDWKYDQIHGSGSFWNNFAFQFDDEELVHLRHDYRNNVIMGGDNWAVHAGLERSEKHFEICMPMLENDSGLNLELDSKKVFVIGEPVVIELKLKAKSSNIKNVNSALHPNFDFTKIAIKKPNGEVAIYEPLAEHLILPKLITLNESRPTIYETAYIGYGKGGFYFDQPGTYHIRGAYYSSEANIIISNDLKIRVRSAISLEENEIGELYSGDEQGKLFYLLGSDAEHLRRGNLAFESVLANYPDHPLSVYAALILGVNYSRDFKRISTGKQIKVRKGDAEQSAKLLTKVFEMTKQGEGVDNITLNQAMRKGAECHIKNGDKASADIMLAKMKSYFFEQNLKWQVLDHIDSQIKRVGKEREKEVISK
ncbi:MAG: hypothetical protein NT007_19065 [Candidatus Kapabacteria bacterium]|nr:hypothetical protein [Candidatus Kapabacteria bacterium]